MTFRLTTLMYLFALVAASLAFLGAPGLLLTVGVMMVWAVLLPEPDPMYTRLVAIAGVLLLTAMSLIPRVDHPYSLPYQCQTNLKQLGRAILNFHEVRQTLPTGVDRRAINGDRHSWRVQVLPFVEADHYYLKFNFDEPWDSPSNRKLLTQQQIGLLSCPSHSQSSHTNYFAITGPQTAWGEGDPRSFDDITDGTSNTILLIEATGRGIHWAEPKDLSFDEAIDLLTKPVLEDGSDGHRVDEGRFYKPSYVRHVAMCDSSVRAFHIPIPREDAIALLTANGGESVDVDLIERYSTPQLDYARVWAFSVFVVLALLPAVPSLRPWIWPHRRPKNENEIYP
jgi:hypothetical protein